MPNHLLSSPTATGTPTWSSSELRLAADLLDRGARFQRVHDVQKHDAVQGQACAFDYRVHKGIGKWYLHGSW